MVWFSDSGREQRPWARVLALAVSIFLVAALGSLRVQGAIEPDSIEVLTYLRTQAPPAVGAPVCLAEAGSVVGNVKSVRLMPGHESTHDLWEVVMELNPQDASKVSTGSVVYAMFRPEGNPRCHVSQGPFLEIHAATPSSHMPIRNSDTPIGNRAVLKGEVTYFAEIAYMLPKPWAKRAVDSITSFVVMDIGTIYIEVIGGGVILIVGVAMLVVRRKALLRSRS
jgi:hypothetical protein